MNKPGSRQNPLPGDNSKSHIPRLSREEQDRLSQWNPEDDAPTVVKFNIHGNPITKKNSLNMVDIGKQCPCCRRRAKSIPLPSKAFKAYEKAAKEQLRFVSHRCKGPVEVKATYWLQTARRPDLTNLMAATHDILEICGIIENDKLIVSVDGSRIMGKDADNPRVEIEIRELKS